MKNKTIKNIGIMIGTSNLAFASGTSGKEDKIVDEKLEDKDEFKNILEILKKNTNKDVDSIQLTKDIFSKLYQCTKTKNKKLNKNILNYSLNFGTKIEDVKDFFKGKIKIDKDKKNIIILKENPIVFPFQGTKEEILNIYKNSLKQKWIILELNNDGVVEKLYNTTINEDKKALEDLINKTKNNNQNPNEEQKDPNKEKRTKFEQQKDNNQTPKPNPVQNQDQTPDPVDENFDTKNIFKSVLSNNAIENNQNINIIKSLNENKLGFGLHDSDTYNIELDGYIIIAVDKKDKDMLSGTIEKNIQASIKSNISSIAINGTTNNLSPEDVIIAQKEINCKKKLLIAKAEDVSKGKIGEQVINPEFYKSSLEDSFLKHITQSEEREKLIDLKNLILENKLDRGQYDFNNLSENCRNKLLEIFYFEDSIKAEDNKKDLFMWQYVNITFNKDMKKDEIIFEFTDPYTDKFEKNSDSLKKLGGYNHCDNLSKDSILFILTHDNFIIASFDDILNGTVNGQKIDENIYENTTSTK